MSDIDKMFESASRQKLRFDSSKGQLTVENLWDLPLTSVGDLSLDAIAKKINRELRETEEESFVTTKSPKSKVISLKFEIVKYIISVRLKENEEKQIRVANAQKRQRIDEILAAKEEADLMNKTMEDLIKMREELTA
jgi:hypothetical protein